jgi:hypothetical protein
MVRASIVIALLTPLIAVIAYGLGRRPGKRMTVPWRPIFQLVDHRQRCLGHDRTRLQREIGTLLSVPPWAWDQLLALRRPLDTAGRRGRAR